MITGTESLMLLKERRVKVLELAEDQRELRVRLKQFQEKNDLKTLSDIARHLQLKNTQGLSRILSKERAVCSGQTFDVLIKALKADDLRRRITSATNSLPTQTLALSLFSDQIIDLVFDLKEFVHTKASCHQTSSDMFRPHNKLVEGLLRCSRGSLRRIESQVFFVEIRKFVDNVIQNKETTLNPVEGKSPKNVLRNFDGETSPLGVRFVLGPKSFKQLEVEASQTAKLINLIKETIEQCRRLLNMASQISDDNIRVLIRKSILGKEIEELELAMRLFSERYPNKLLELNSQQRAFWATLGGKDR